MKKLIYLLGLCGLLLLISGCSDKTDSEKLIAKKTDLDDAVFESRPYQFELFDGDKLRIMRDGVPPDQYKIFSFDKILFEDGIPHSVYLEFDNVKVETKDEYYFISADGLPTFKLKKFMNHIVMDEEGREFIRNRLHSDK